MGPHNLDLLSLSFALDWLSQGIDAFAVGGGARALRDCPGQFGHTNSDCRGGTAVPPRISSSRHHRLIVYSEQTMTSRSMTYLTVGFLHSQGAISPLVAMLDATMPEGSASLSTVAQQKVQHNKPNPPSCISMMMTNCTVFYSTHPAMLICQARQKAMGIANVAAGALATLAKVTRTTNSLDFAPASQRSTMSQ